MDVEMRQASPESKGSHGNRAVIHGGSHDEMTLARLGKKQVLKVRLTMSISRNMR